MPHELLYSPVVCTHCRHVALLADDCDETRCAACSAPLLFLPGAKFLASDLPLFAELERIVYDAQLAKSDAALIAADLESVSRRWEPPELVLAQLSLRLPGLSAMHDPQQEYARWLLLVSMLLTIVGARLAFDTGAQEAKLRSWSGIRELAPGTVVPGRRLARPRGRRSH